MRHLTYANLMATIAVFVALGGGAYAAVTITSANVRNNSLTGADIRQNSLRSGDIRNGTLLARDFKPGQLPAGAGGRIGADGRNGADGAAGTLGGSGARGLQGPKGDKGDPGVPGAAGATNVVVRSDLEQDIGANGFGDAEAQCLPGERAVGGGGGFTNNDTDVYQPLHTETDVRISSPVDATGNAPTAGEVPTGWRLSAQHTGTGLRDLHAYAICAAP
jgi:hypothetical protein